MKNRSITPELIIILEIHFFLVWRFSGFAPGPVPLGNPLFVALLTLSFYIPLKTYRLTWKDMGLTRSSFSVSRLPQFITYGVATALLSFFVLIPVLEKVTGHTLDLSYFDRIRGNVPMLLAAIGVSLIYAGFLEELIYRGFLLNRFGQLFGASKLRPIMEVALSSVIFGLAHSYQGIVGILLSTIIGIILAMIYISAKRNLWYAVAAHAGIDISAAVMVFFNIL